jgi:hypothetical protein
MPFLTVVLPCLATNKESRCVEGALFGLGLPVFSCAAYMLDFFDGV